MHAETRIFFLAVFILLNSAAAQTSPSPPPSPPPPSPPPLPPACNDRCGLMGTSCFDLNAMFSCEMFESLGCTHCLNCGCEAAAHEAIGAKAAADRRDDVTRRRMKKPEQDV